MKYKVGMKVYCPIYGKGEVIAILDNYYHNDFPVEVRFKRGVEELYTKDGRMFSKGNKTLKIIK